MNMWTNHSKFQREVLISLLWHVHKHFAQFSNTCVCGHFDDNFWKKLTKSTQWFRTNLFKCIEIKKWLCKTGKTPKKLRTRSKWLDKQSAKRVLGNLVAKPWNLSNTGNWYKTNATRGSRPRSARLLSRDVRSVKDFSQSGFTTLFTAKVLVLYGKIDSVGICDIQVYI